MAFDAFLKIKGVDGEATAKGYEKAIELYSFSWGASNPTTIGMGSGGGAGKVSLSSFNIMKRTDVASAPLFTKCCTGEHLPEVLCVLRKAGGANPLEYLTYKFTEVYVDSIQWSGSSGGDDTPSESVSLTFAKVEVTYKQQDDKGGAAKTIGANWDLRTVSKS